MKNIFHILLLLAISFQVNAQETLPVEDSKYYNIIESKNKYFKDVNGVFDKFVGTWKYQDDPINPTKILEVTFYKLESRHNGTSNATKDCLSATYKYYENGILIYDIDNPDSQLIYGGQFRDPTDTNKYHLLYGEPNSNTRKFYYNFNIEYLLNSGGTPQLKWDVDILLEEDEGAELPRIPQHIILTKQS